uniref:holin n=1 Tax=Ornithobacterium rhinotracheale TaxID=28251 RepID=UPI0039A6AB2A
MILDLMNGNYSALYMQLYIICSLWVIVLVAILVDLHYGVKKSKLMGECRTSEGYRRTINKVVYYYSLMVFAMMFDFMDVITPIVLPNPLTLIPMFSVLGAFALVFTEVKSVHEKAEDKLRRKTDKAMMDLIHAFRSKEDLMNRILDTLKEEKEKQDGNTNQEL